MPYDKTWFSRFDTMVAEAGDLEEVQASLKAAKEKLGAVQGETDAAIAARKKSERFMKEQEDRIKLVSTHWFFGTTALQPQLWMRGGVEGKMARAKTKLEIAKSEHPILLRQEAEFTEERLPAQKEEVKQLGASIELKKGLKKETADMREAAIAANPSNEMQRLRTQIEALQTTIKETATGADGVKSVGALCGDANEYYVKACKLAEEASAAGRDAETVVGPIAAKQGDNTRPSTEPAEAAEAKERLREAAVVVLNGQVDTLKATIAATAAGGDGLKACHTACLKASTCYASALKMTIDAAESWRESERVMRPADKPPLYGAAPALEKRPCPSGSGYAITWHVSHCCGRSAELDDGVYRPDEHDPKCDKLECCDMGVERAAALEHLRREAATLRTTIKATSEGADGLKAGADLETKARAKYERCIQLTKWAKKAEAEADKVVKPTRPCPGGCGFAITAANASACCGPCERGSGEHGPKCEGRACGSAVVERAAALKDLKARASLLKETLEDKTWAAEALKGAAATCQKAQEAYLKAMQARRAADRLAPSPLDDVLEDSLANSASLSARDAKMREVQKEGDEGAKLLQKALDALPGGTHGTERFASQYETFADVSGLASSMDTLATVQSCVTLVAEKMKLLEEIEALLRKELNALRNELTPIEGAFKVEAEREGHMDECGKERAEGDKLLQQGLASVPPPVFARYAAASQPLAGVQVPMELRESMELAASTGSTCKDLEATLRKDYDEARGHLAPIEQAVKAIEKSDGLVQKAQAEADKGGDFLLEAFKATPAELPTRYPQTSELIDCEVVLTATTAEAQRIRVIRQMASLASLKERKGKECEVTVRKDHEAARAELKPIELALKAEQQRGAKLSDAQAEGDRGAHLLHQASATVPVQVPVRYPQQSATLVGLQVPLLAQANPQDTVLGFFGEEAKGPAAEWASADKLRQTLTLTAFCQTFSAQLQATAKELEATLRADCNTAKIDLQDTQDAVPVEEERIFAKLRAVA